MAKDEFVYLNRKQRRQRIRRQRQQGSRPEYEHAQNPAGTKLARKAHKAKWGGKAPLAEVKAMSKWGGQ
jgi:hypothetical protein